MSGEVCRERFPTISKQGQRTLDFMRLHPAAPMFRNESGNKLLAEEVQGLLAFEREVLAAAVGWLPGTRPAWLAPFIAEVFATVPHYRQLGSPPASFDDLPPVCRADFASDIAQFVPDHVDTARMIAFRTSGTTGHPMLVASHPVVAGRYLAYHKRALRRFGIEPTSGSGQVGVVLLGHQLRCFTYVSVTPTMGDCGLAKINLHPNDWRTPDDRARYLDALAPEIIAGDPVSFAEYLKLPVTTRPRALISVSMMLLPGLRKSLELRFGCPVLDIYSLNEVGPVAVFDTAAGGHVLLQERLFVEILDSAGQPVAPGEVGEITVTGGFNFCLPHGVSVRNLMTLLIYAKAMAYFRGNDSVELEDLRQVLPFVLHDKLQPDMDAPFFELPENAAFRTDRVSWLRRLFDLSNDEFNRLDLDRDDPVGAMSALFAQGLDGVSERETRTRLTRIEKLIGERVSGRKLYGHLYDDLLKLKYLHQRYTNYLVWLRSQS